MAMFLGRFTILLFVLISTHSFAQLNYNVAFAHATTKNGLSNNQVNTILEDKHGFIWVGTISGLNRFDGYNFQMFSSGSSGPNGMTNNAIVWLENGPDSTVWIQTGTEIVVYNTLYERFERASEWYAKMDTPDVALEGMVNVSHNTWFWFQNGGAIMYDEQKKQRWIINTADSSDIQIHSNNILRIRVDKNNDAWVLYANGHVDVIDHERKEIKRTFEFPDLVEKTSSLDFNIDSNLDLWMYSLNGKSGVVYVNTASGEQKQLNNMVLTSNVVNSIIQDKKGYIWIGTDHGGVTIIDKETWKTKELKYQTNNDNSIGNNNVKYLYRSSSGIIWVALVRNGLSFFNENSSKIQHFKLNNDDSAFNDMSSLAEDSQGNLWIGTNGEGLVKFDTKTKAFADRLRLGESNVTMDQDVIVSLQYASDNSLWIGTYTKGLFQYKDGKLKNFSTRSNPAISDDNVWCVEEDQEANIWIGTIKAGLNIINPKSGEIQKLDQSDGLSLNYVTQVLETSDGQYWIATGNGANVYNAETGQFKIYLESDEVPNHISNNSIVSIFQAKNGTIWVGTLNGLNRYIPEKDGFQSYYKRDGLPSNIIMSIEEDLDGHIWVSTDNGIAKINLVASNFDVQSFNESDGLQGSYFNERTSLLLSNGLLAFGGQNGLNLVDPKNIEVDEKEPNLVFTNFYLNNKLVTPSTKQEESVIQKNINSIEELELNYHQNSFAFEFAALTFDQAQANQYEYMLEGFEEKWVSSSPEIRRAVYTNINPGNYTFKVRSSNSHNVWNESPRSIQIIIYPPFWSTIWAYVLYAILGISLFYLIRYIILSREREKAKVHAESLNAKRLHELDLLKLKFFTNISHEFRTPISLVLTPIEQMIKHPEKRQDKDFHIIHRNAKRLLTLVNQLLDFRKMEAKQHKLSLSLGDLLKFMNDVIESFADFSEEKEVKLELVTDLTQYFCHFDQDKMDKIMFNLLSNAFKFTLPGGKIEVEIEEEKQGELIITVRDTGIGIPENKLDVIFDRFIQADSGPSVINSGTGIGLSITKEFVELHGGKIDVQSKLDVGTTFQLTIPFDKLKKQHTENALIQEFETETTDDVTNENGSGKKPKIIIVEDNSDFRFYIKDNLSKEFRVQEATNGKEAWKKILQNPPDVIVSDIMMPIMDGIALCKKVKSDPRTANIPVILLTAQTSNEHKLEGLRAGALEYITKPFNFEILVSSINSALKFQEDVSASNRQLKAEPSPIEIVSVDEQFLNKALKLVEDNISNSDFSVAMMGQELGFSRGHLYQKMLQVTGKTPLDFIRDIRMEIAAEYLLKSQMTVSEIAYKVGYNNPKLFSRYFKSKYKVYPSKYVLDDKTSKKEK